MITVSFEVPGRPMGSPRVVEKVWQGLDGATRRNRYLPPNIKVYAKDVQEYYRRAAGRRSSPHDGPVALFVTAFYQIPKTTPKKQLPAMLSGSTRPPIIPDGDNILKAVTDSLNKVAYQDDRQIFTWVCEKVYAERPRVEVALSLYEPGEPIRPMTIDLWEPEIKQGG